MSQFQKQVSFDCVSGGKQISGTVYEDEHNYLPKAEKILKVVGNCRLVGDTGAGKTQMVYKLAEILKGELFEVVLTRDTTRWDLIGCDTLKQGESVFREGIILKWLKSPFKGYKILYLDGFNYAEPNIIALIESLGDFRGNIWIPELNSQFSRSDKHLLVISYNPSEKAGYSGTFIENIATIRRFEGIVVEYLSVSRETKLLQALTKNSYDWCRKFVELGNKSRIAYKEGKLRTPITTGNLLNYARLRKAGLSDNELIEIASSLFAESERGTFLRCWEEAENTTD